VSCRRCASDNNVELHAEVNIHTDRLTGLDKPAVLVFPKVVVCLHCGFVEFNLAEDELRQLAAVPNGAGKS